MTFSKEWYEKYPDFSKGKNNSMFGRSHSKETKIKMSRIKRGKNSPMYGKKGKDSPLYGRHHTKEAKRKMSENNAYYWKGKKRVFSKEWKEKIRLGHLGKKRPTHSIKMSGQNNPSWCGGKSFDPYSADFNRILKQQIRKRDQFRCRQCFRHEDELGYNLIIHHIDFDKKNNNPINLISLCHNCHGQTNFGREDWKDYFIQSQEKSGFE